MARYRLYVLIRDDIRDCIINGIDFIEYAHVHSLFNIIQRKDDRDIERHIESIICGDDIRVNWKDNICQMLLSEASGAYVWRIYFYERIE